MAGAALATNGEAAMHEDAYHKITFTAVAVMACGFFIGVACLIGG